MTFGAPGRAAFLIVAFIAALALSAFVSPSTARADDSTRPSVLVLEAGLGDYDLCVLHWLGDDVEAVAESQDCALVTAQAPAWWGVGGGTGPAPRTFVLGKSSSSAIKADDIAWALDQIRASGAEPRAFVVAMGATGLPLREYAEGLASQKQEARADIVGLAFCGTPQGGYSALDGYPELSVWADAAKAAGLSVSDVAPGSDYLKKLDGGAFPKVVKVLSVYGSEGDLGFGLTDGMAAVGDMRLPSGVSDQVEEVQVSASAGQAVNLTGAWSPFTSSIDYPDRKVDPQLVELLSSFSCYETSDEVQAKVREFYDAWFSGGSPVTHNSSVIAIDLSGSMLDDIGDGEVKLAAAQAAAKDYLLAMQAISGLPQSAPMDVVMYGFSEYLSDIASGYDDAACAAVDGIRAVGDTDIGLALDRAVAVLAASPTCASKHVLLLSDGERTLGQTEEQMLAGPVAEAQRLGIVIDTIGFGDVGDSNVEFLKQVASTTGGSYYEAQDTYGLKVDFLKAYYSSLGMSLVDEELEAGASSVKSIGSVDERTAALQIGIVAHGDLPQARLLCDGAPLDASAYGVQESNGLLSLQCVSPPQGEYSLELSGGSGSKHVFAVEQQGIWRGVVLAGQQEDYSLYMIIGAGALLVVAIALTAVVTRRRGASGKKAAGKEPPSEPPAGTAPADEAPGGNAGD